MIRITRMTDYGIVLLTYFARSPEEALHSARDLAREAHLPLPTVNKVLKTLTRHGLLESHRGVKGGYTLSRRPEEISVAEIITATEGPVAMTECTVDTPGACDHESECPVSDNWQRINQAIQEALGGITLAEMTRPVAPCSDGGSSGLLNVQGLQPS
jgi:FeS assembly SUF system regulator